MGARIKAILCWKGACTCQNLDKGVGIHQLTPRLCTLNVNQTHVKSYILSSLCYSGDYVLVLRDNTVTTSVTVTQLILANFKWL